MKMRVFAAGWGIFGVLLILGWAVARIAPHAWEAFDEHSFSALEWSVFAVWMVFMIYAEGFKGFHCAFAPRVVARARTLISAPTPASCLLAPLFCFGFFRATRKRMIVSWSVAGGIVLLILGVRLLNQPWRGIIDSGVVAGLSIGAVSILYFTLRWVAGFPGNYPPDLPEKSGSGIPDQGPQNRKVAENSID